MSKLIWIDVPQGYLYGFPKLWDKLEYPDLVTWLVREGYPEEEAKHKQWIRCWDATEEDENEYDEQIRQRQEPPPNCC